MSDDKLDYDKLVKDYLRLRLMECGWTDQLSRLVYESIAKRIEGGQTAKNIKFDELYSDVINKAHDIIPEEMETEIHGKMGEYLSHSHTSEASSSSASATVTSSEAQSSAPDDPPDVPLDTVPSDAVSSDAVPSDTVPSDAVPSDTVPSDTVPSDTVPSNDETWTAPPKPKRPYYE